MNRVVQMMITAWLALIAIAFPAKLASAAPAPGNCPVGNGYVTITSTDPRFNPEADKNGDGIECLHFLAGNVDRLAPGPPFFVVMSDNVVQGQG